MSDPLTVGRATVIVWTVGASLDYHDDYAVRSTEAECVAQLREWFPAVDEDKTLSDDEFINALIEEEYGFTGPDRCVLEAELA